MRLDDELGGRLRQRREDAAAVEPAHAAAEDRVPVEVARLEQRRGLVGAVVEDDRRADAVAAVAVDRRHVRPAGAVVLEVLVERRDAHRAHALGDQIADRVVDHRGRDAGAQAETVGQVRGDVELAAADVDRARVALRNGTTPGSRRWTRAPSDEKVERAFGRNREPCIMRLSSPCETPSRSTRRYVCAPKKSRCACVRLAGSRALR